MSLKDELRTKMLKNSTIKETAIINKSKILGKKDVICTAVPMINVALSGSIDGGLTSGVTIIAGPSKNFKTGFSLLLIQAFLKRYKDGIVLFYDSEFGTPHSYFKSFNIDLESIIHTPITNIEELKHDLSKQIESIKRTDQIMIVVDSIGNLASKKEVQDALDGKSVADMTRAKMLKSVFRIITPHLSLKDVPFVAVNHTYQSQEMFSKPIVSGGTGLYYSSDNIWIVGRQQDKNGKEIKGYHFIINIEKSRFVKEKSKIPISVSWLGGINKWSGLLEVAQEHGSVIKTKPGWYASADNLDKSFRERDIIRNGEFWIDILKKTDLAAYIKTKYQSETFSILEEDLKDNEK